MSIPDPQGTAAQHTADTRERILAAAGRVFARKGFRAASLDQVAQDAGLTKGAIYWHFDSKAELFFALLDHKFVQHTAPVPEDLRRAALTADPRQAITLLLKANFARLRADEDWPRLYLEFIAQARDADMRARLATFHDASLALVSSYITTMQQAGIAPPDRDVKTLAVFWSALFDGLLLAWIIDPQTDLDPLIDGIVDLLWRGIVPTAAPGTAAGTSP